MVLSNKVKTALDETRLLILGAQVLLGFKLRATFQDGFSQLTQSSRLTDCLGQFLMALSVGLLIASSMQNLIVESGQATNRLVARRQSMRRLPYCGSHSARARYRHRSLCCDDASVSFRGPGSGGCDINFNFALSALVWNPPLYPKPSKA